MTAGNDRVYVEQLRRYLPEHRVVHSQNVADAAQQLAGQHCPELMGRARLAGLLHDNAKYMSGSELLETAAGRRLDVSPAESAEPGLLHGKVGAALLSDRFGVVDRDITEAVADHVTGRRGMDGLSLVLFVADQIAQDREFSGVEELREIAQIDLLKAAAMVSRYKIMYVLNSGKPVIMETIELYNELLARLRVADG